MLTSQKTHTKNIPNLQNIALRQNWHSGHGLIQSRTSEVEVKETRDGMTQESLMMNLNKSLFSLNYPKPNVYKTH